MKVENIYINLFLLILGFFTLQSVELDSFSTNLFLETDIEESIDDRIELDFEEQLSDSDSGNGNNAVVSNQNFHFINPFIAKSKLANNQSKGLSKKPHLFILYCCLKLDC